MGTLHDHDLSTGVEVQEADQAARQRAALLAPVEAELYARFFQVLSDPTRVRLLHLLLDAPDTKSLSMWYNKVKCMWKGMKISNGTSNHTSGLTCVDG